MKDGDKTWVLHDDEWGPTKTRVLVVSRGSDGTADSEGPALYSMEDVDAFIADLRAFAERMFGGES